MKLNKKIYTLHRDSVNKLFCFVSTVFLLFWMTALTTYSQATYADIWLDNTNQGATIIGRGSSEINYTDEDGVEVEVRITSPNGRPTMTGAFGEVSVQADARLSFDWEEFGEFFIRVERFPMCSDGTWSGGDEGILIRHGYNSGGGIWWRPTGFQRCPRNTSIFSLAPTIILHAYQREASSGDYIPTCCSSCTVSPRYRPVGVTTPYTQCASFYLYRTCLQLKS
jgi:hypothetical protein